MPDRVEIRVYLECANTRSYIVDGWSKAREHAAEIVRFGYVGQSALRPKEMEHYPPHMIRKVKLVGDGPTPTKGDGRILYQEATEQEATDADA